jgi:hypothetical protein
MTMPAFTIVTTSATQETDAVELSTLTDEFVDQSEALGYARRMADEMVSMAHQLSLDFDYSNVGLYEGDLIDEELDPTHAAFLGAWVLDEEGVAFVPAEEFLETATDADPA